MLQKTLSVAIAALIIGMPALSAAEGRAYPVETISKLGRGVVNILASPEELLVNMFKQARDAETHGDNDSGVNVGYFTGVFVGVGFMFARIGVGVADIVSFPIPTRPFMSPATPDHLFETIDKDSGYDFPDMDR